MGWKLWTRERLTTADMQALLQDQAVLQFASVSARDAAIATGARKAGMLSYTQADGTYWGCDADGGTWRVLSQIAAPVAVTVNTGWGAISGFPPKVSRGAGNRARLTGRHNNTGAFAPNGTQFPITLPTGYRPAWEQVYAVPFVTTGAGSGFVIATLLADGRLRYDSQTAGSPAIGAGSAFFLDSVEWNLLYGP